MFKINNLKLFIFIVFLALAYTASANIDLDEILDSIEGDDALQRRRGQNALAKYRQEESEEQRAQDIMKGYLGVWNFGLLLFLGCFNCISVHTPQ